MLVARWMVILGMRVLFKISRRLILLAVLNVLNVSNLSVDKKKPTWNQHSSKALVQHWIKTVRQYPNSSCPAARSGSNFKVSTVLNDPLFTLLHLDGILVYLAGKRYVSPLVVTLRKTEETNTHGFWNITFFFSKKTLQTCLLNYTHVELSHAILFDTHAN